MRTASVAVLVRAASQIWRVTSTPARSLAQFMKNAEP